ncbi:Lrp/AsnC family transcriptional regulator [Streptomyces sp. NPDC055078]
MQRYQMDESDHQIVELLRQDGRMALTRIGKSIGLSTDAVRGRVARMTSDGVLRVMGLVAPEALGYHTLGSVALQYRGPMDPFLDVLKSNPNVTFVAQLIGDMNVFCGLVARDDRELGDVVNTLLVEHEGVHHLEVARQLGVVKWFSYSGDGSAGTDSAPPSSRAGLDDLDVTLLTALVANPRATFRELEELVSEPYWAVRSRVRKLFAEGHVRATATIDRVSTVPDLQALIRIGLRGRVDDEFRAITELADIRLLVVTTGTSSHLSGEVACADDASLARLIETVLAIDYVDTVRTYVYSRIHVLPTPWRFDTNYLGKTWSDRPGDSAGRQTKDDHRRA